MTRDTVVTAAVGILGSEGGDALTLRRLAHDLGVTPMALYRHVTDKDELLDLALDQILGGLRVPDGLRGWEAVAAIVKSLRDRLLAHPGAVNILMDRPTAVPNALSAIDEILAVLAELGLDPPHAVQAFDSLLMFTLGSVRWQLSRSGDERLPAAQLGADEPDRFPALARHAHSLADRDPDRFFHYGLDRLLAGIRAPR